ncbi:MAG TPA: hypothetical protein PLF40_03135 [Kofleriaceae bacterium]|nr:hypothetical protein [Kofleriaceae bacterium]
MIKVNQIQSAAQALRLAPRIDMAGVCVGDEADAHCIGVDVARAIHDALPGLPLSVALPGWAALQPGQVDRLLQDIGASHFEFTPVDLAKPADFAAELLRLQAIRAPKIANGFFLQHDDLSFASDLAPYHALQQAGVVWFQFEIGSAVALGVCLSQPDLQRVQSFLAGLPVLATDQITALGGYPLSTVSNFFFNLGLPRAQRNYDFGQLAWAESQLMKLLPQRAAKTWATPTSG